MNTSLFRILGCLLIVFLAPMLKAQTHSENLDAYKHLFEVNKEWTHFKEAAPAQKINFRNDTKRIRFHLETVIRYLSQLAPIEKTVAAQAKRLELLTELKSYAEQEVFPQNIYHTNRQPYFIDYKGTHCAVGYLMKVSGAGDLAIEISKEHNYDYLPNIKTEGVLDWATEHGFSLKELALIQPAYTPSKRFEELGKGINGSVTKMFQTWDKLYIVGDFDLLDSLPCLNIGVYEMGQLSCLGNGIDGKVNGVTYTYSSQMVVVVGDLISGGSHYPIATYETATGWTFHSIPGRANAEGVHIVGNNYLNIAIKDPSVVGTEIWENSTGGWQPHYTFHGAVLDMSSNWYVGLFDSLTLHQTGIPDTLLYSHNAIAFNYNDDILHSFSVTDTLMPDTIQAIETIASITYFGGYSNNPIKPCLTRLLNNTLQPLIFEHELWTWNSGYAPKIFNLNADPNSGDLYFTGDFEYIPFNGNRWTSIGKYKVGTGALEGYNSFDSSVTSVAIFEDDLIIGGHFQNAKNTFLGMPEALNYLARLYVSTSVNSLKNELTLKVFPNPTSSDITIDFRNDEVDASVEVSNTLGQVVYQEAYFSTNTINLPLEGVPGMYLVKVKTAESESMVKVLKQ